MGSGGHRRRQIRLLQSPWQRSSAQAADDRQGQVLQRLGREEDQGGRRNLHPHRLNINNNNNMHPQSFNVSKDFGLFSTFQTAKILALVNVRSKKMFYT